MFLLHERFLDLMNYLIPTATQADYDKAKKSKDFNSGLQSECEKAIQVIRETVEKQKQELVKTVGKEKQASSSTESSSRHSAS